MQESFDQQKLKELNSTLGPFLGSDGIIRCKGRLMNSDLPYDAKCPVVITPSHLTTLIISYCDERVIHDGVKETLAELCTHFWLAKESQRIKAVVSSCNTCRRLEPE